MAVVQRIVSANREALDRYNERAGKEDREIAGTIRIGQQVSE